MIFSSFRYIHLQVIISYLGLLPFLYVIIDINLLNIFFVNFLKDFIIYYSLLVFSFIGSMRWSFTDDKTPIEVLYGFVPSLISSILIFLNLINIDKNFVLFLISIFFILQLIGDFYFFKSNILEKLFLLKARIPLTLLIIVNIFYLIMV